jgi:hypothetical protein
MMQEASHDSVFTHTTLLVTSLVAAAAAARDSYFAATPREKSPLSSGNFEKLGS